jgi:Putative DNA-binding domain
MSDTSQINIEVADSLYFSDASIGDLVRLRKSTEDHFVERKTFGDWKKDALKTIVAFANSLPIAQPGYLFIGVRDNGDVEAQNPNLDTIQKNLADLLKNIYPRVPYIAKAMSEDGNQYLVIIVHGSEDRPHFSGPSFVREGSTTVDASEEHYKQLIAQRQSKVRELLAWKGRSVLVETITPRNVGNPAIHRFAATIVDCNEFFVTVETRDAMSFLRSYTLSSIELNFDHEGKQLKLERR